MCSMVDPSDFCRECKGTGQLRTETERGTLLHERCWMCGGIGQRTVRVFPLANAETLGGHLDAIFSSTADLARPRS